jgi:hypothetical protein
MTVWSLGEHGDVEARLTSAFSCFLEQVLGLGLVWETTGGRGAAVWVPPDRFEGVGGAPVEPSADHRGG